MSLDLKFKESDPTTLLLIWEKEVWREVKKSVFFTALKRLPSHLTKGDFLSHFAQVEERLVKSYAYRCLSKRPLLSRQLATKLKEAGFSEPVVAKTVEQCQARGWIDDAAEIQRQIAKEQRKGRGKTAIFFKLKGKEGMDLALVQKCLNEMGGEEEALQIALKKQIGKGALAHPYEKQKVIAKLVRRGFSLDAVFKALSEPVFH